jgi:hypothetical protein
VRDPQVRGRSVGDLVVAVTAGGVVGEDLPSSTVAGSAPWVGSGSDPISEMAAGHNRDSVDDPDGFWLVNPCATGPAPSLE